ncbi:MAG: helix-turn-helix domain-containing protein [Cyclobacteriaceae bacterium]|nr:helix-turn-helix domain-containing protein [Cyclobacteriaceae bacterium]
MTISNNLLIEELRIELSAIVENSVRKVLSESDKELSSNLAGVNDFLDIQEASRFLGLAVPTLYSKVSQRLVPHSKRGKKLFFSKSELIQWIKDGNRKTLSDIQVDAEKFISTSKKNGTPKTKS